MRLPPRHALLRYLAAAAGIAVGGWFGFLNPPPPPVPRPVGVIERLLTPAPVLVPDSAVREALAYVRGRVSRGVFPGAAVAIGNRGLVQVAIGYGQTRWDSAAPPVSADSTLYDVASLTKAVATTAAVMALVEDRKLTLDDPVRDHLPELPARDGEPITIRHLLTHTSGLRAGAVKVKGETPDAVRRFLLSLPRIGPPGENVLYSDLGFIVLWMAAERAAGEPLPRYLRRRVWQPLGMTSTRMGVPTGCERCAPTLYLNERDEPYTGGSYDELGRRLNGIAGNSGAFSTARDLARFAAMMANEGRLGDVRVFRVRTVRAFTRPQPGAGTRALGWEVYCGEGIVNDNATCDRVWAYGHTGVTGTSLWVNAETGTWVVLLANRTYLPKMEVDMQKVRRRLFEIVSPREPQAE